MWKVTLWKGTKRHEKARASASWAPHTEWICTKSCCNLAVATRLPLENVLKVHVFLPAGQKSSFSYMTISRNAPLSGGGRSRMKISLNFIEFHWIQQILEMNKEKDRKKRLRREKKDKKKEKIIFVGGSRSSGPWQAARQGRLWPSRAFSRSYFFKVKWILNEFLPKFDRLVLGCINEFLNFFFEFVESVLSIRSFLKKNAKIRKKKREKEIWTKITIFRIFPL